MVIAIGVAVYVIVVIGLLLAYLRWRESRFAPTIAAYVESELGEGGRRRVLVRVTNRGGATGFVRGLGLEHGPEPGHPRDASLVGWTGPRPVPFYLPGRSTAVFVFLSGRGELISATDRVRMEYGADKVRTIHLLRVPPPIDGVTSLPPNSLPAHPAPAADA